MSTSHSGQQRVEQPVPGLWDSISPDKSPAGWKYEDTMSKFKSGKTSIKTNLTAPDGTSGLIHRSYDPGTKTFEMNNAFLNRLSPEHRWTQSDVPMVSGKGMPTQVYHTLRQMKLLGANKDNIDKVKMSTIQNVEAIAQLAQMRRENPRASLDELISKTHSVQYAKSALTQAGLKISSTSVDARKATESPIDELLQHYEAQARGIGKNAYKKKKAEHEDILNRYDLKRSDKVLWNYNINMGVGPH